MYVNLLRSSHPNKKSSLHAPDVECILVVTLSMLIASVVAFSGSIRGPDIFNVRLSTQTCTPVVYSAHCGYGSFRPRVVAITFRDCQNHHSSISFSLCSLIKLPFSLYSTMLSASVIILEWICPLLGVLMANVMFLGESSQSICPRFL
jgi:hypothetical protein